MYIIDIKDECRKHLIPYTIRAFSIIPKIDRPKILDAGCGTGVPALALYERCDGDIYAVDPDKACIGRLNEKARLLSLQDRLHIIHDSILNPDLFDFQFDIILAEGLLNAIGFNRGLQALLKNLKSGGYLIIHDELKKDAEKRSCFENHNLRLLDAFEPGKEAWLKGYYECLEMKLKMMDDKITADKELREIRRHKSDPNNLSSVFYVLQYTP